MLELVPQIMFDKLDFFLLEFAEHDREIKVGVAVVGDPAAYALVWEWGNTRQTQPGPRTVLGTNPNGEMVWMSSQAPFGYIRRNEEHFWDALENSLGKVRFDQPDAHSMTLELERAAVRAAKMVVEILHENAPRDSGDLADAFVVVDPTDPILDRDSDNYETFAPPVRE